MFLLSNTTTLDNYMRQYPTLNQKFPFYSIKRMHSVQEQISINKEKRPDNNPIFFIRVIDQSILSTSQD